MVREVYESSVLMGRRVLAALGRDEAEIVKVESGYRTRDKARLRVQADKGMFSDEARQLSFRPGEPMGEEDADAGA